VILMRMRGNHDVEPSVGQRRHILHGVRDLLRSPLEWTPQSIGHGGRRRRGRDSGKQSPSDAVHSDAIIGPIEPFGSPQGPPRRCSWALCCRRPAPRCRSSHGLRPPSAVDGCEVRLLEPRFGGELRRQR
jgi:hypothetical protein